MRREPPRQRFVALDHFEHRLLFAVQILLGTGHDGDRAVAAQSGRLELLDGVRDPLDLALKARLETDEGLGGIDRERCDDDTLHELVRVGTHQRTILERARFAFRAVAHEIPSAALLLSDAGPLLAGWETAAATPTQT